MEGAKTLVLNLISTAFNWLCCSVAQCTAQKCWQQTEALMMSSNWEKGVKGNGRCV